ncbi:MAG TPA: alkaline phosphatase family protein [Gemmatimonadaceae bacterium]|nr:alkaline phosphatase family protein [Gemmatimonadaceae bacterium]
MRQPFRTLLLLVCFPVHAGCQSAPARAASGRKGPQSVASTAPALPPPSLIVLITIDQFRGDYLDRFGPQLRGGLARLSRGGAWFTNAHHDHAITETAPGHATLLSGRFPRSTGIMANRIGVEDELAPLLANPDALGASPKRFQGTTLVDWLHARDSRSRTLSVSAKDRGAILPVGRSRAEVYWYYPDGRFTTSRYYRDSMPDWVNRFNARKLPQSFAGKGWTLLLPDTAYKEADNVSVEMGGHDFVFPHPIPDDSAAAASVVRATPGMDEITLDFALDGLNALSLGDSPRTDVLAISLSATDYIGHGFGPDSREMHDNVLRLDRNLGVFIDSLFRLRDSSKIAIVLTADHGIGTIPELVARSVKPTPVRVNAVALAAVLRGLIAARNIDSNLVDLDHQVVLADRNGLGKRAAGLDSVLAIFATQTRALPGISRVDRFQDLLRRDTINDPITRRWVHQFPARGNVEMVITLTPFSIFSGLVATHGSPYDYDSHVPLIFAGPWFASGRYPEFVRTVDLAPTLAEIARVKPSEKLDGVVLRRALK